MALFKVLYGRRCHTTFNWIEPREKVIFIPDIIEDTYANKRCRPLEFEVGDRVYLRVSPKKGVKRFGVNGKLAPQYIGPFPILEKIGTVAYKLDLPPSMVGVHDIFHVSQLKKCLKALVDIVLLEMTLLKADLTYPEHPIKILDQKHRVTRRKTINFFKVQWSRHLEEEATWESWTSSVLTI
jgi:hypothetical protein